jgi:ATP-dependent DNA ligase
MNSLYSIITSLQQASGSNAKLAILQANKDNELLKKYVEATLSPKINFYITKKTFPKVDYHSKTMHSLSIPIIEEIVYLIAERHITGKAAHDWLSSLLKVQNNETQQLIEWMLLKDFRAGVGEALVSKVWPEFKFTPSYQRCSLMDEKITAHFSKPSTQMIVQEKMDGSFAYLIMDENGEPTLMTRNGSVYPKEFAKYISTTNGNYVLPVKNLVLVGELVGYKTNAHYNICENTLHDRKTSNGVLNSIQQGNENYNEVVEWWSFVCWDLLDKESFDKGQSDVTYERRLGQMKSLINEHIPMQIEGVHHRYVDTLAEAYEFYQEQLSQGKEGAVLKDLSSTWKDGTSKLNVKMKLAVDIDLVVTGFIQGTGKASGMLGALCCASSCEKLVCDVGTGFTDEQRKDVWSRRHDWIGKVVQVKANDLLDSKGKETYSLFLPVFQEMRFDKSQADSLERIREIFNAAKGI